MIGLVAALALASGSSGLGSPKWAITQVDRTSLIAVDTNTIKLGLSGAQAAMLIVVADPEPQKPTVIMLRHEFDCWAHKASINGGLTEIPGEEPVSNTEASRWEAPAAGSMLASSMNYACRLAPLPKEWLQTPLTSEQLIDAYFAKVLGRENPFKAPQAKPSSP